MHFGTWMKSSILGVKRSKVMVTAWPRSQQVKTYKARCLVICQFHSKMVGKTSKQVSTKIRSRTWASTVLHFKFVVLFISCNFNQSVFNLTLLNVPLNTKSTNSISLWLLFNRPSLLLHIILVPERKFWELLKQNFLQARHPVAYTNSVKALKEKSANNIVCLLSCGNAAWWYNGWDIWLMFKSSPSLQGYRGGVPTADRNWRPCPLWEPTLVTPVSLCRFRD